MKLFSDGGYSKTGAYGSWRLETDNGEYVAHMSREPYPDIDTNNGAEYVAILRGLTYCASRIDEDDAFKSITIQSDSKLVIHQILGEWKINFDHLRILREKVVEIMKVFDNIILRKVPRKIIVGKLGH